MERYTSGITVFGGGIAWMFNLMLAYIAAGLAYLNISAEVLGIYIVLMVIDLLTGVTAGFVRHERIVRRVFFAGLATKILLLSIPVVIAMLVKINGAELAWLIRWTMIVLSVSETLSILNNYLKAKGSETLPEIDAISLIARKLRAWLVKLFNAAEIEVDFDRRKGEEDV